MHLSRRRVIIGAATVAALAALGVRVTRLPGAAPSHRLLSDDEFVLVTAIADGLFPPGNPLGVAGNEVAVAEEVDRLLATELDPEMRLVFRYLIRGLDLGTVASRGRSFAALDTEARADVMRVWSDSSVVPRRMAFEGIKLVVGMAFMNDPKIVAATGWEFSCWRPQGAEVPA